MRNIKKREGKRVRIPILSFLFLALMLLLFVAPLPALLPFAPPSPSSTFPFIFREAQTPSPFSQWL